MPIRTTRSIELLNKAMMKITSGQRIHCVFMAALLCLSGTVVMAQANKTVIGSTNPALQEGADALLAGDAEEGVRLTLMGLRYAISSRNRQIGMSNLCAGYLLLNQLDTALSYCDQVLEKNDQYWRAYSNRALIYVKQKRYEEAEQDLQKGEAISPKSRTLKAVRTMLLDQTNPVAPEIVIDDRRTPVPDVDEK